MLKQHYFLEQWQAKLLSSVHGKINWTNVHAVRLWITEVQAIRFRWYCLPWATTSSTLLFTQPFIRTIDCYATVYLTSVKKPTIEKATILLSLIVIWNQTYCLFYTVPVYSFPKLYEAVRKSAVTLSVIVALNLVRIIHVVYPTPKVCCIERKVHLCPRIKYNCGFPAYVNSSPSVCWVVGEVETIMDINGCAQNLEHGF